MRLDIVLICPRPTWIPFRRLSPKSKTWLRRRVTAKQMKQQPLTIPHLTCHLLEVQQLKTNSEQVDTLLAWVAIELLQHFPLYNAAWFNLRKNCYKASFFPCTVPEWYQLPHHIQGAPSVDCFKSLLMRDQDINELIAKSHYYSRVRAHPSRDFFTVTI